MMEIAGKKILFVDESKFHFSAVNCVTEPTAVDVVLVSQSVDRAVVNNMKEAGVKLELV